MQGGMNAQSWLYLQELLSLFIDEKMGVLCHHQFQRTWIWSK